MLFEHIVDLRELPWVSLDFRSPKGIGNQTREVHRNERSMTLFEQMLSNKGRLERVDNKIASRKGAGKPSERYHHYGVEFPGEIAPTRMRRAASACKNLAGCLNCSKSQFIAVGRDGEEGERKMHAQRLSPINAAPASVTSRGSRD
ncbi:hypothetical protein EVAR_44926_1 [Eumeta japonica]|uniref:Uncharacterized protein n=1 Tax=Eumeta variegata TaxID=151549 RepID=A0A4C2AAV7_EUMVA|nr:hypothetical protein EVAR_44926_1 [Eumeta japonica]